MKITVGQFADKNKVSKKLAKTILDILYSKGLDATKVNSVVWRLESFFIKTELKKYLEKVKKEKIEQIVDEIIEEIDRYESKSISANEVHIQLFSDLVFAEEVAEGTQFKAGQEVEIQIMRVGTWNHPLYGKFAIGKKDLKEVVTNFNNNTRGVKLAVDENHEPDHKALAWFESLRLSDDGNKLYATLSLTTNGAKILTDGAYKYFSPEIIFKKKNEETGKEVKNLLIGGAFTNRPFFKSMEPLMANEDAASRSQSTDQGPQSLLFSNLNNQMNKFLELVTKLAGKSKISASEKAELEAAFNELEKEDQTTELQSVFNETLAKFDESAGEGDDDDAAGDGGDDDDAGNGDDDEDADDDDDEDEDDEGDDDEGDDPAQVQASEPDSDGNVQVNAKQFAMLQETAGMAKNLLKEKRKNKFNEEASTLVFSEDNKAGVILPKTKKKVLKFCAGLTDTQATEFFEILKQVQTKDAKVIGSSKTKKVTKAFKDSDVTKEEALAFYEKDMGMSREEAEQAFAEAQAQAK